MLHLNDEVKTKMIQACPSLCAMLKGAYGQNLQKLHLKPESGRVPLAIQVDRRVA